MHRPNETLRVAASRAVLCLPLLFAHFAAADESTEPESSQPQSPVKSAVESALSTAGPAPDDAFALRFAATQPSFQARQATTPADGAVAGPSVKAARAKRTHQGGSGAPGQSLRTYASGGYIVNEQGNFRLARQPEPEQPLESAPTQPRPPSLPGAGSVEQPLDAGGGSSLFGASFFGGGLGARSAAAEHGTSAVEQVTSGQINNTGKADLTEALSQTSLAVQMQRRGQVQGNPFIRGFKNQQIYSQLDGQYFLPIRTDLDTITSKIDPGIVQDVIVIEGPYSVQYGPGFSFFDIVTAPTPRNQRAQYRSSGSYIMNGSGFYGRETVSGGGSNYGYRFSYGHRNANDYKTGGGGGSPLNPFNLERGARIPSHYNYGDFLGDVGYDLAADTRLEVSYRRFDQNHTAYPGQFFDIASQESNALNLRLIDTDPTQRYSKRILQGWYNRSNMTGNTLNPSSQGIVAQIENGLITTSNFPPGTTFQGNTVGDVMSTGGRVATTYGDLDDVNLTTGIDARVLSQRITEFYDITSPDPVPPSTLFSTGMPRSRLANPGAFAEMTLPWSSSFKTRIGGRGDYVYTAADSSQINPNTGSLPAGSVFHKNDGLYSFYMTNTAELNRNWTANVSFGQAQRPPTLIDRYADGVFLGILQSGFSRVIGNPGLSKERNWQIDASLSANYDNYRGSLRGYQSWVINYITYSVFPVIDPTGARILNTINTPLATLSGFETFHEFGEANNWIKPFAAVNYVYGVDQTIHQALPQIPPLQSRLGFNFQRGGGNSPWGISTYARVVAHQDRNGYLRTTLNAPEVTSVELRTPGFTTANIQGYWQAGRNLTVFAGIDNAFNRFYIEHLSLHTGGLNNPNTWAWSPGCSPYVNVEWTY